MQKNRKLSTTGIQYRSRPPLISPYNSDNFYEVFFSKWKEYKHEKEYRLQYVPGIYARSDYVINSIKEIIFGCATSKEDKELVKDWVKRGGSKVIFYEAHLKPKSYNLILKKCNI